MDSDSSGVFQFHINILYKKSYSFMAKKTFDALVILERSLKIFSGETVYGFYVSVDDTKPYKSKTIAEYTTYLLGVSQLYREGGYIADDERKWYIPKHKIELTYNAGVGLFLNMLLRDFIKYRIVRIDPVVIEGDGLVIDAEVIERYSNNETIEIGGEECAEQ